MKAVRKESQNGYVLITAARNEELFIERAIVSVARQTVLPLRWIIVDNGSTDRTREVVTRNLARYPFLRLMVVKPSGEQFAQKVHAINLAYEQLRPLPFAFVGVLDADITLEPRYYEQLLALFGQMPRLGIAGGTILEPTRGAFRARYGNAPDYVAGAVQMFRRRCFEAIGGYMPLPFAHEDTVASEMARMRGWEVVSFPHLQAWHHRQSGTGHGRLLRARFCQGQADYAVGYHPLFELVKFARRLNEVPWLVGSTLRLSGYLWAALRRMQRPVDRQFVAHLRARQMARVTQLLRRRALYA
ncbi:MAG: glycosyltransferase family 2 protein [candidate division KSB1 bacterium]|nr:glycosyltransferase family 2 protein [candidate division KSB1 bacterium]MDZ7296299.1 glycosyltransferase family 2 protein [candidate division KSB1 bacterium]